MSHIKTSIAAASAVLIALSAGSAFAQSAQSGTCQIYQDYDYGGKSGTVVGTAQSGDAVLFVNEGDAPQNLKEFLGGRVGYRLFYDPSWNNMLSSVKVASGCTAEFHNSLQMQQGSTMPFDSYTSDTPRVKNNDSAKMVICRCN